MFKSASEIETIGNKQVKHWFQTMYQYMLQKLNDKVNQYRDYILKYAMQIRNTPEFKQLDLIMLHLFTEYRLFTM